jgi:hypothetical protein
MLVQVGRVSVQGLASLFYATLISVITIACGADSTHPASDQAQAPVTVAQAGPFPIALPSQVYAKLRGVKQVSSLLTRDANDYVAGFSQRVNPVAPEAIYSPAWVDGYSAFDTVSYAIYRFDLTARQGKLGINTKWTQGMADKSRLWIGASNWQKDRWDWSSGAPAGIVDTGTAGMELYKHPDTNEMYVAVVVLGQGAGLLRKVWLNCSLRGDWWMYGRNATHHSCSPFHGPGYSSVMWSTVISKSPIPVAQGSPVYDANGIIYVNGSDMQLFAINRDGSVKWQKRLPPPGARGDSGNDEASPVVDDDGTIYAVRCGSDGALQACTPAGDVKWSYSGHGSIMARPAIRPDGTLLVSGSVYDSHWSSPVKYYLYAVSRAGIQVWEYCFDFARCGPPAIAADGTAYVCHGNTLSAFDTAGKVKWSYQAGGDLTSGSPPVIGPAGRLYITSTELRLYALDADGTLAWSVPISGASSSNLALGTNGQLYLSSDDGSLYCYDSSGAIRWSYYTGGGFASISVDGDGTVYVPGHNCRLFALKSDGTLKWWIVTPYNVASKPVIGEDGAIYVMTNDGTLHAIGPGSQLPEYAASGYVKADGSGAGMAGVTVNITGEEPVVTDANGYWSKSGLTAGHYIASANKAGYRFKPGMVMFDISNSDIAIEDAHAVALEPVVWQMQGMDRGHTRRSPHTGPAAPDVAWSNLLAGRDFKYEPAIGGDGVVYFLSNSNEDALYAFSPDGTVWWHSPEVTGGCGPALSAVDGTVYASCSEALFALTPAGVLKWSSGISGDLLTIAPDDSLVKGRMGLVVLEPTGHKRWSIDDSCLGVDYRTSPAIGADGVIYAIRVPGEVCAINPDGSERWATTVDTGGDTDRGYIWTAVADDGTLYASIGRRIFALDADGASRWTYAATGTELAPPAIGVDGAIYTAVWDSQVLANMKVIVLNTDGTLRWDYYVDGYSITSPVTLDAQGTAYVCVNGLGDLYALNADGTLKWTFGTQSDLTPVSIGEDGTLYFGNRGGYIYALGPGTP